MERTLQVATPRTAFDTHMRHTNTFRLFARRLIARTSAVGEAGADGAVVRFREGEGVIADPTASLYQVVAAAVLLERLRDAVGAENFHGREGYEFRLFSVALMIGHKTMQDATLSAKTWSAVSGIQADQMGVMELEFLMGIGWKTTVEPEEIKRWLVALTNHVLTPNLLETGDMNACLSVLSDGLKSL
ncbi:hypothetical protein HK101_010589 [Irineochytrium annulatum]|nr:hypothetical protein HK101_010589 [Irineochytrium annulatum]